MSSKKNIRCAVIGNPIAHSRSPEIHHLFAAQFALPLKYSKMLADKNDFTDHVRGFFAQGGKGLNITVPFKEKAFAMAEVLSPSAEAAEAVNTLWMKDGKLHGCNTDGIGLVHDLRRLGFDPKSKRILLIGAGGAAKGVLLPLLSAEASLIHIVNRTAAKAEALASQHPSYKNVLSAGSLEDITNSWDIVINATSSSLNQQNPLPETAQKSLRFSNHSLAYDMMYGSEPTVFMQEAQAQGASQTADGLGMLVGQAAQSFTIWHSLSPDTGPVLKVLRQPLAC